MRSFDEMLKSFPHKELREIQKDALEKSHELLQSDKRFIVLELPPGCHAKGTRVLMYDGSYRNVEDIRVGDEIMGPDSTPRKVLRLNRGCGPLYRVQPTKGKSFTVNADHILSLRRTHIVIWQKGKPAYHYRDDVVNISVQDYLGKSGNFKHSYYLYKVPIEFQKNRKPLIIPPYILGLWLGDGTSSTTALTNKDEIIIKAWKAFAKSRGMLIRTYDISSTSCKTYNISSGVKGGNFRDTNSVLTDLRTLGVFQNKHVPVEYKTGTREERLELLAGLIDTDGYYSGNCYQILQKRERLIEDIIFVAQSLGFGASRSGGRFVKGIWYYGCCIYGEVGEIPVRLKYKRGHKRLQKKNVLMTGFKIQKLRKGMYYGFIVDRDNLYVMDDFFVTHNCGKTAVGWTLAHAFESGYFLTIQKLLQDQYIKEMGDMMAVVKGQNSYQCAHHPEYSCEDSVCSVKKAIRKSHTASCPYVLATDRALSEPYTLFNMHSFYFQYRYGKFAGLKRDLLVVDEGHLVENTFMSLVEITLPEEFCEKMPMYDKAVQYKTFLYEVRKKVQAEVDEVDDDGDDDGDDDCTEVDADIVKRVIRLKKILLKLDTLLTDMEGGKEWVHMTEPGPKGGRRLVFKPLFVGHFIKEYLYKAAIQKVVIMSATIGSFREFCDRSGIDKSEACIIRGPSPFPIENREIHYRGAGSMGRKNFENSFPKMVEKIKEILDEHKNEKGVIQAHSEWLAAKIVTALNSKRVTAKNGNVIEMLDKHSKKDNSVIVAAGISTGLDLKDDLSRFQIIAKVPYPSLGDAQMKRRFELSQDYYFHLTALTLMQSYGRSVRSSEDSAVTYILDSDFGRFLHFNKRFLSEWFLEALQK